MNILLFTVKPVVSSRGCTLSCKFFLNLHTTCINISGVCLPRESFSVYFFDQIFACLRGVLLF